MVTNKKGFTLIEILATIFILALIFTFATVGITKILKDSNEVASETTLNSIKNAANIYSYESDAKQWKKSDKYTYDYFCVTVGELINKGLLKKDKIEDSEIDIELNTYIAVSRDKQNKVIKNEEIIGINSTSEASKICTGNVNNEKLNPPTLGEGQSYTDEIRISFENATSKIETEEVNITKKECMYGLSSNDFGTDDEKNGTVNGNVCSITSLKQNTIYYIRVCMTTDKGSYVCSDTNSYSTKNAIEPEITVDGVINIKYDDSYINGSVGHYFKSTGDGIASSNVSKCALNGDVFTCSDSVTSIEKNIWYKTSDNEIKVSYSGENKGVVIARTADKSNNYTEKEKEFVSNKVIFVKGNADKVDGMTTDIEKNCIAEKNEGCKIVAPTFEKIGYTPLGWSTKENATNSIWDIGNERLIREELTFYPISRSNIIYIKYKANGGVLDSPTTNDSGEKYYWKLDNDVIFRSEVNKEDNFSDSFHKFEYGKSIDNTLYNYNNLKSIHLTKEGYIGTPGEEWICESGCETGKKYSQSKKYLATDFCDSSNGDCTAVLKVNWEKIKYTVNYSCNGGTGTAPANQFKIYDEPLILQTNTCSNAGYIFDGWNTKADGSGIDYAEKTSYITNNNLTLYAKWKSSSYTVTLNKGKGIESVSGGGTYNYGEKVIINATVSDGYTWSKWSGNNDVTTMSYTFTMPASNVSYTANAIDITPPTVPTYNAFFADGSGKYTQNNWTNKLVHTTLTSTDSGSGVSYMQYKEETTGGWKTFNFSAGALSKNGTIYTGTEPWNLSTRNQTFYFRACDNGADGIKNTSDDNCSNSSSAFKIMYDLKAPSVPIYNAFYANNNSIYNSGSKATSVVHTTLSSIDEESGVVEFKYYNPTTTKYVPIDLDVSNGIIKNGNTYSGTEEWEYTNNYSNGSDIKDYYFVACDALGNCSGYNEKLTIHYLNTYKISYNCNGGTGTPPATQTKLYGQSITLVNNTCSKKGYTFGGWQDSKYTYNAGDEFKGNEDVELKAFWKKNNYKITINKGEGISGFTINGVTPTNAATYTYGESITLNATISAGYKWGNWSGDVVSTNQSYTFTMPSSDVIINANAIPLTYYIELDDFGGTTAGTERVYYQYNTTKNINGTTCYYYTDSTLTKCLSGGYNIEKPTKTGYIFQGYFTDWYGQGTQYVDSTGKFINNVYKTIGNKTLYANWIGNSHEVKINKGTGIEIVTGEGSYKTGDSVTVTATPAGGYSFNNWTGTLTSTNWQYTFTMPNSDVELTANATSLIYNVTLDKQGGSSGTDKIYYYYNKTNVVDDVTCYYYNSTTNKCLTKGYFIEKPTKVGYTFAGYFTEVNGGGIQYVDANGGFMNNIYKTIGDRTLYAKWLDQPEPTCSLSSTNKYKSSNQTITASITKSGSALTKYYWGTSSTGTPGTSNTSTTLSLKADSAGMWYLRVQDASGRIGTCSISMNSYTVTNMLDKLDGNQGTYNKSNYEQKSSNTYIIGDSATIELSSMYTNPGVANFAGYSKGAPSDTAVNISVTTGTITNNTIYTMWWNRKMSNVTLTKGTGIESISGGGKYKYGASVTIKATISSGYTWNKWTGTSENANQNYTFNMPESDVSYKANATANTYTINYYLGNGTSTAGSTSVGTSTCTYGESCTLKTWASLGKTFPGSSYGWGFGYWANANNSTTKFKDNGESFTYNTAGDMNLYAVGYNQYEFFTGLAPTTPSKPSNAIQYWNPHSTSSSYLTSIVMPEATAITGWTLLGYVGGTNNASSTVHYGASTVGTRVTPAYNSYRGLRAVYSRTLTIAYNANGGSGTVSNQTGTQYYNSGANNGGTLSTASFTLKTNSFTRTGYSFSKWAAGSTAGTQYAAGDSYSYAPAVDSTTTTQTMFAVWDPYYLKVNYYSNYATSAFSGTANSVSSSKNVIVRTYYFYYGTSYPNGLHNYSTSGDGTYLARSGYTATGLWGTNTGCTGTKVSEDKSFSSGQAVAEAFGKSIKTGNVTISLYPQWTQYNCTRPYDTGCPNGYTNTGTQCSLTSTTSCTLCTSKTTSSSCLTSSWCKWMGGSSGCVAGSVAGTMGCHSCPSGYSLNSSATSYRNACVKTTTSSYTGCSKGDKADGECLLSNQTSKVSGWTCTATCK